MGSKWKERNVDVKFGYKRENDVSEIFRFTDVS